MGNGAGVALDSQSYEVDPEFSNKFSRLEKRAKSGFFEHEANEDEYLKTTTMAIEKQYLDMLEVLIKGGDMKSLYPLHIAAKCSSTEAMDLFLSAGFSPFQLNLQGKTPLHQAAASHGEDAVLCVHLLLMYGEKALKMKDKNGNTPLHIAVLSDNATVVENLLAHSASLSVTNNAGNSPRHLAKSMKHQDILEIIDEKRTGKLRKKKHCERSSQSVQTSKFQQERIMKVWEKFFENALMGVDFELDDNNLGSMVGYESESKESEGTSALANALFKEDRNVQNSLYPSESYDYNYNFRCSSIEEKVSYIYDETTGSYQEVSEGTGFSTATELDGNRTFRCASEWFSWVLAYEHDSERRRVLALSTGGDGSDGYYVSNCFALDQSFDLLDDHLDRLDKFGLWQGYDEASRASDKDESYGHGMYSDMVSFAYYYPGSVKSAISAGWINFFDVELNCCYWMHIPSGLTETYLPLGDDVLAWELGLEQQLEGEGFDTDLWLMPPQVVARSWVMVSIEGQENGDGAGDSEDVWYFSNRVTGHSSWEKPEGWEELLEQAGGWVLCAEEAVPADLYWWHSESGEVVWYNEDYATE